MTYKYAASSPGVSFDCSGLTSWAWGTAGVGLPHQSARSTPAFPTCRRRRPSRATSSSSTARSATSASTSVAGMMIDAPNSGATVRVATVNWGNVTGVGRPS